MHQVALCEGLSSNIFTAPEKSPLTGDSRKYIKQGNYQGSQQEGVKYRNWRNVKSSISPYEHHFCQDLPIAPGTLPLAVESQSPRVGQSYFCTNHIIQYRFRYLILRRRVCNQFLKNFRWFISFRVKLYQYPFILRHLGGSVS